MTTYFTRRRCDVERPAAEEDGKGLDGRSEILCAVA